jgi:hypothetical protein
MARAIENHTGQGPVSQPEYKEQGLDSQPEYKEQSLSQTVTSPKATTGTLRDFQITGSSSLRNCQN